MNIQYKSEEQWSEKLCWRNNSVWCLKFEYSILYTGFYSDEGRTWRMHLCISMDTSASTALYFGSVSPSSPFERYRRFISPSKRAADSQNSWHLSNTDAHVYVHWWATSLVLERKGKELNGEVRRKMNFTYVLGFVVLRDVVKVLLVSSSSFASKTTGRNRARSHSGAWRGRNTKWDLKLSLPSPTYLIQYLFI